MNRLESCGQNRRQFFTQSAAATAALYLPNWVMADEEATRVAKRNDDSTSDLAKLGSAIKLGKDTLESLKKVKDFEATFTKREVVGKKMITAEMYVKFREQPFSVYLKFLNPHAGREAIYVAGKNKDRILAHASGVASIVGTVKLKPDSKDAMEENRYPITSFGLANLVSKLVLQWEADEKHDDVVVKFFPNAKLDKVDCKVVESSFPKQVPHAKFHISRLYIAKETGLPMRVEQLGFPAAGQQPPVIEEYTYSNVKTNVGLTDLDFDTDNKAYGF